MIRQRPPAHVASTPDLQEISSALLAAPAGLGPTRLLAIDGPAGSGKTTTAAAVHGLVTAGDETAAVIHMDDLYEGWTGLDRALERRVLRQLLHPFAEGRPARWQQYDWHAERFDRWHDVAPPQVLVLEGCGAGAQAYASYLSLLVWIEASRSTRLDRGARRDGVGVLDHWLAWMELEATHFAVDRTRERANLRYQTG